MDFSSIENLCEKELLDYYDDVIEIQEPMLAGCTVVGECASLSNTSIGSMWTRGCTAYCGRCSSGGAMACGNLICNGRTLYRDDFVCKGWVR